MKKLLLITGDLATGKSTFAGFLSDKYNVNVFYKDTIKEILGDTVGFSNREENLKLSKATMELMLFLFSEFSKLGKGLILEANFHKVDLDRFHEMAFANNYEILTLDLRGDPEILHKRYLHRITHENRHPVHLSTTFEIYDDFKEYLERSRNEEIPGNVIHVNASDFSYRQDEVLMKAIDRFWME